MVRSSVTTHNAGDEKPTVFIQLPHHVYGQSCGIPPLQESHVVHGDIESNIVSKLPCVLSINIVMAQLIPTHYSLRSDPL
jgi:hypothetical protein